MKAGRVDVFRHWYEADAPDAQHAAVFGGDQRVFLSSRQQKEVLVSDAAGEWLSVPVPSRTAELTSIALDPFDRNRFYAGTLREGIFIHEGPAQKYDAKKSEVTTAGGGGGGSSQ